LGALLMVGGQGILTWGAQYLPSWITGLLNSTVPLWIAILALVIFKRRLSKLTLLGCFWIDNLLDSTRNMLNGVMTILIFFVTHV